MASDAANSEQSGSSAEAFVKRRELIKFGTMATALTGASALAAFGVSSAHLASADKAHRAGAGLQPFWDESGKDGRTICQGFSRADVVATLNAAEAKGRGSIAHFPAGVYDVGATLSLSGYSCQIHGEGAAGTKDNPAGTVFYASTQDGPVLDFEGYIIPTDVMTAKITHRGFMVHGSGVADPSKNNSGIRLKTMSSTTFADIAVRDTGGPCLEFIRSPGDAVYLCDFERIILNTPIDAAANDVPYFLADEPNGNRFRSFGFRSLSTSGDCGASGAVVITSNDRFTGYDNLFDGFWFENLHIQSGGTLMALQTNRSIVSNLQLHDIKKESEATGTSVLRFSAPPIADFGGNQVVGVIPGSEPTTSDTGVDVRQSRNSIVGVKGYKGANVTIASGVTHTYVALAGAVSGATNAAVIDNSGNLTNTYLDYHLGIETHPNRLSEDTTFGSTSTRRVYDALTPNNGGIGLGKTGAAISALEGKGSLFYTPGPGQFHIFNDGSGAEVFKTTPAGIALAAGKSMQLASSTTASRPSAKEAGRGATVYDETLLKPIWSDGTDWRDALGQVV